MKKTLIKHGNSYAMVIERPILELLHATPDTPFDIMTDGRSLVLTPVRDNEAEDNFNAAIQKLHKQFGGALKRLAD